MGLDYPHTCPDIDGHIKDFENDAHSINGYVEELKNTFNHYAEAMRKQNADIRDSADRQIGHLEDRVSELTYEIDESKKEVSRLLDEIRRLELLIQ